VKIRLGGEVRSVEDLQMKSCSTWLTYARRTNLWRQHETRDVTYSANNWQTTDVPL